MGTDLPVRVKCLVTHPLGVIQGGRKCLGRQSKYLDYKTRGTPGHPTQYIILIFILSLKDLCYVSPSPLR